MEDLEFSLQQNEKPDVEEDQRNFRRKVIKTWK